MDDSAAVMEGAVTIADDGDYVAKQLWPAVQSLIFYASGLMKVLFSTHGVPKEKRSAFYRDFSSLQDLRDEFIRYRPCTFGYADIHGLKNGVDDVTLNADTDDISDKQSMVAEHL